ADHPVTASSTRREGRRRVGHGGGTACDRERCGGRAVAPRRDAHRYSDHAREGLAGLEGERRGGVSARRVSGLPPLHLARIVEYGRKLTSLLLAGAAQTDQRPGD